jgi:hypothetical protein
MTLLPNDTMSGSQDNDMPNNILRIHHMLEDLGIPPDAERAIKTFIEEEIAMRQGSLRGSLEEATSNLVITLLCEKISILNLAVSQADANLELDKHKVDSSAC